MSSELWSLRERAKELRCLYEVNAALAERSLPLPETFARVLAALARAWQFPDDTTARVQYFGRTYASHGYLETSAAAAYARLAAPICLWQTPVGLVEVLYASAHPDGFEGPFLREERELLDNVAQRIGEFLEWKQRAIGGERVGADPEHWRWRQLFAERISAAIDPVRFGVLAIYVHGSTESGEAGIGSDIDLLVVHEGDERKIEALRHWLEGWSLCLAELRSQLHGVPGDGVLDVRYLAAEPAQRELLAAARAGRAYRALPLGAPIAT